MTAQLYVGPLSRFFAPDGAGLEGRRRGVEAWRADLLASLAPHRKVPSHWPEEPATEHEDFALGEPALRGVRLLALYAEHPELLLPDALPPDLERDGLWSQARQQGFSRSSYGHLLAAECWLPGDFDFTMRCPRPDGEEWTFGSLVALRDELRFLNARTFQADVGLLARWSSPTAECAEGVFLSAAQKGLGTFVAAVGRAVALGLPVVLRP
jgi:hypothetical protein